MQEVLNITMIQCPLFWEQPEQNRTMFSEQIATIEKPTDLIVLPEMFTTGFSMNPSSLAETNDGPSVKWMQEMARKSNSAITGSIIIQEEGKYFNRMFFVFPDGHYEYYDKRHTFTFAGEDKAYQSGDKRLLITYKGWKIFPLICYDLRFPVWARNSDDYDVILYVASWPQVRMLAWDTLLRARAIENMAYCVGVNRTGIDGNNHEYVGHSAIYDPLGVQISKPDFEGDFIETVSLSKRHLQETRTRFHFLDDRDTFEIDY